MGKFAKRLKRQQKAGREQEYQKAVKARDTANKQVKHATTMQVVQDMKDIYEAETNLETLTLLSIHEVLGFGRSRLERFLQKANMHKMCLKAGLVKVSEINQIIYDESKIFLQKPNHEGKWGKHYSDLLCDTTNRVMACHFIALIDEFGIKETRLKRLLKTMTSKSEKLTSGEVKMKDLKKELVKIMRVKMGEKNDSLDRKG